MDIMLQENAAGPELGRRCCHSSLMYPAGVQATLLSLEKCSHSSDRFPALTAGYSILQLGSFG